MSMIIESLKEYTLGYTNMKSESDFASVGSECYWSWSMESNFDFRLLNKWYWTEWNFIFPEVTDKQESTSNFVGETIAIFCREFQTQLLNLFDSECYFSWSGICIKCQTFKRHDEEARSKNKKVDSLYLQYQMQREEVEVRRTDRKCGKVHPFSLQKDEKDSHPLSLVFPVTYCPV
jgi:hypothetical protein